MMSFYYAIIPARGNWLNKPDRESDDRAFLLCVLPLRKIWHYSGKIRSTFVIVLWFSKTEITDGTGILVLVRVLWDVISKIYWQFRHCFLQIRLEICYNFCPIEITWRKMVTFSLPVSMATWRLHTLWRFTLPAYKKLEEAATE